MRTTRLTDLMGTDASATGRHVAHAVDRGRIDRRPDSRGGRIRLLRPTGDGRTPLAEMHERTSGAPVRHLADRSAGDAGRLTEPPARLRADCGGPRGAGSARSTAPHPAPDV
ncbi:hypothetical protein ACFSJS_05235 [Streptomyces desertarenae]|uniref:MarR family transcriptional regulator n=1 Tax=Streptomyces desertarenae TaxID=2666184 RepID=A0ABW4PFK2_9ACTN